MIKHFDITISGEVKDKGLAFRILKSADELNISGTVTYTDHSEIVIEAEGFERPVVNFINWCKSLANEKGIHQISVTKNDVVNFSQFNIKI